MLPIFTKPLEALTVADLEQLVAEKFPEGSTVEYKQALPGKDGREDPWMSGGAAIGEFARNKLLEEIVAFANAHGGQLLIGIKETAEKPASAEALRPLPRAADLAERIRMQARDCIEPKLPLIHSTAVRTDDQDNGVVVVRVPQSRMAPHRHIPTWQCFTRRSDRTEKMTMREIQDLTLAVLRGSARLEAQLAERREKFVRWSETGTLTKVVALRITATPVSDGMFLPRVFGRAGLVSLRGSFKAKISGSEQELALPRLPDRERPILRGATWQGDDGDWKHTFEVFQDGMVDSWIRFMRAEPPSAGHFLVSWILAAVWNVLLNLQRLREEAGAPELEYALELQMHSCSVLPNIVGFKDRFGQEKIGDIPQTDFSFPRYSVATQEEFVALVNLILRDLLDSIGFTGDYTVDEISP